MTTNYTVIFLWRGERDRSANLTLAAAQALCAEMRADRWSCWIETL